MTNEIAVADAVSGWEGDRRSDGMTVDFAHGATRFGIYQNGQLLRVDCPCCDKPFLNPRAAKLVANALYPMPESGK